MGVRDKVASGRIDQEFLCAARRAARSVTASKGAPSGNPRWSNEEIDELVNDAIVRTTTGKIELAANKAASDKEFISWLCKVLRNEQIRRFRGTPLGHVIEAVGAALREAPDVFEMVMKFWRLCGDDREPGSPAGRHAELVAVAHSVHTEPVRVARAATKTPPFASRDDIRSVSEAVLAVAGPLSKPDLARVHADRFDDRFAENLTGFGDDEVAAPAGEPDGVQTAAIAAQRMLGELTEEDKRVLLACLSATGIRGVGDALGCGKARAQAMQDRLTAKLDRFSSESDNPQLAVEILMDLARQDKTLEHSAEEDECDAD